MNQIITITRLHLAIVVIVIAAAAFLGGMKYSGMSNTAGPGPGGAFTGRVGGPDDRARGAGFAVGTVTAMDAQSLTLSIQGPENGAAQGSKIIIMASSTKVGKFVEGSSNDLIVGTNIMVSGTPNSDGSITATNIQIRPASSTMSGFGGGRNRGQ